MKVYLFCALGCIASASAFAGLTVVDQTTSGLTDLDLANGLLGGGSGITINSASGPADDGTIGTFSGGVSSGLPFKTGIVLSSGDAKGAEGPNDDDGYTGANGNPGGTANGVGLNDLTSFLIEFTPVNDVVSFQYVFASEEYNEFTNSSFNDSFFLLLNGTNIALLPDGTTEVTINNVNGGNPFGTGASNPEFFRNNDPSDGGPSLDIQYDGLVGTKPGFLLFAEGAVNPGVANTLEFVIGDRGDSILDSAVFLAAGSFFDTGGDDNPTNPVIPEPSTYIALAAAAALLIQVIRRQGRRA